MLRFKAFTFLGSYLGKIENPILEFQEEERIGEIETRTVNDTIWTNILRYYCLRHHNEL